MSVFKSRNQKLLREDIRQVPIQVSCRAHTRHKRHKRGCLLKKVVSLSSSIQTHKMLVVV